MDTWNIETLNVEPSSPQVLRSDDELRAIVLNLPAGDQLQEHQVHERAWLLVATGKVRIEPSDGGDPIEVGAATIAHFEPKEAHAIKAVEDTRLLLMLVPWPAEDHNTLDNLEKAGIR